MLNIDSLKILTLIGNTPLYKISWDSGGAEVWIKLEGNNPGGSIKDRAAFGMLKNAQLEGKLHDDTVIIEPTSGNTGIGLALLGRALGLRVILTMPESMSVERRTILRAYGAELVLTPAEEGMKGAILAAGKMLASLKNAIMLDQFSNQGNPMSHELTTGPEIIAQLPKGKKLAAFVCSFGTGGTLSGVGRALKRVHSDVRIIGVEPASSPLITKGISGVHKIQGIGANFIPANLDMSIVSEFVTVTDDDAMETAKKLAYDEGLFSGISTGANVFAALKVAQNLPNDTIVVTIQPDRGDKYLSVF